MGEPRSPRVGRDAGSRSRSAPPTSTGCGCCGSAGRAGSTSRPASTPSSCADFRNLLGPGRDCLQADVTRCGGITGLLQAAGLAGGHGLDLSGALRAADHAHAFCAVADAAAPRVLPRPRARRAAALRRRARAGRTASCARTASRPGHGLELRRADGSAAARTVTRRDVARLMAARRRSTSALEHDLQQGGRRRGALRRPATARSTATDGSNYRQLPIGVVIPRDGRRRGRDRRASAASTARRSSPAAAAPSLAGPDRQRRRRDRLLEVPATRSSRSTPSAKLARVAAGRDPRPPARQGRARPRLTFGPDPSTHDHCTFGGMIGNNSCGVHSVMAAVLRHRPAHLGQRRTSSTSCSTTATRGSTLREGSSSGRRRAIDGRDLRR